MTEPRTVLVVDDDLHFAEFLRAAIEAFGHRAVVVTHGSEATQACREHDPSLVFLDILLPGRDGFQVCDELRALPGGKDRPVIMMTGIYRRGQYQRQGIEKHGAVAYLFKPLGVREIWSLLEEHVGRAPQTAQTSGGELPVGCEEADLATTPLAAILAGHVERESDGVLFVRGDGATFVVYVQGGRPIFVRSNDPDDRLDRVLVQAGAIATEDLERGRTEGGERAGRVRLGEALVERGLLTPQQVENALQVQMQMILDRVFRLAAGRCLFVPGEHPTEEDVHLALAPLQVLLKGARASGSDAAVAAALPDAGAVLRRLEGWQERVAELTLVAAEEQLLAVADGDTTVGRYLAAARLVAHDGARTLHAAMLVGLIGTETPARRAPAAAERESRELPEDLVERPFAAALVALYEAGGSGRLTVRAKEGGPAKHLQFRRGRLVAVASDVEEDRLADVLTRSELVPETVLDEVSAEALEDDDLLRRELVARGVLGLNEAWWAHVHQLQHVVRGVLPLRHCVLTWTDSESENTGLLPDLLTEELVWDAVRSSDDATVAAHGPDPAVRLVASPGAAERASALRLTPAEIRLLSRLEGRGADVAELAPDDGAARRDASRTAWGLLATSLALVTTAPAPASSEPSAADEAFAFLHDAAFADEDVVPDASASAAAEPEDAGAPSAAAATNEASASAPEPPALPLSPLMAMDLAAATDASAHVAPETAPETAPDDRLTRIAATLGPRLSVLRALRSAMNGDERRVLVDRVCMAELLDAFLAIGRMMDDEPAPVDDAGERETVGSGSSR